MSSVPNHPNEDNTAPSFCEGIQHFGEAWPEFESHGSVPVIAEGQQAIGNAADPAAAYQTLQMADALRYLTHPA